MNDDLVTCGACGARNPHSASWCSQCYASLGAPDAPTVAVVGEEAPRTAADTSGARTWTCAVCNEELSIDLSTCTVCGAEIFESFGSKQWDLSAAEAMRAGLVPGGGLMKVNRSVEGIMVLIVTVFGVGFGASIISVGGVGGWLLILLGVALWVVAAREAAVTIAAPRQTLLSPKVIMGFATVIIVVGMLLVFRGFPTEAIGTNESFGGILP